MDKTKKKEIIIEEAVRPIIERNGYEYVGVEIKRGTDSAEIIIYADREGGIGLDDCENISRLIDSAVEDCDPMEDSYFLCVSSPGLDRELKTERDFKRAVGKRVDLKLYSAQDGKKEFCGELLGFDEEGFEITVNGDNKRFSYKQTAAIRMHVEF